jgi:multidrug efflux pump subunit AcrB
MRRWLAWALDHRRVVAIFAAVVMLSSVPLYRAIHQEYVPSDVDEAEFYVWVTAPEGHRHRRDGRRDADGRAGRPRDARRADRALRRGGGFLGNVNTGYAYVRIKPHAERYFSLPRLVRGILRLDPLAAFRGNYTQRDVMQALRAKFKRYGDLRISVRNAPAFNLGGAPVDIDFNIRGPDLQTLRDAAEKLRTRMLEMGGIADADTTLKLDKPELRVVIDRDRAADLGVDVEHVAMAMRLMVGGDDRVSPVRRPDDQRGLRRRGAPRGRRSQRSRDDRAPLRARAPTAGWRGSTASRDSSRRDGVSHRPPRPPARREHPRDRRARATRWATGSTPSAPRPRSSISRRATRRACRAAAASSSARSSSSSGHSCCRSRSCT